MNCALSNPGATTGIWQLDATDAWGHETLSTLGNGVLTTRSYDLAVGHLDTILAGAPGQDDLQSLNYTWDLAGNLLARTDQLQGGLTESFEYDGLNRVTYAQVSAAADPALRELSVSYDAIGNITSKSNVGTYSYGSRPHAVTSVTGTRAAVYTYDENGNQTSGAGRIITWTPHNRPASIVQGANSNAFTYGPDRERIRQDSTQVFATGSAAVKSTIYVGGLYESEAVSGAPLPVMAKHFIQAGGRIVAIHTRAESPSGPQLGTFQYLHHDHLGSVDAASDGSGAPMERFSYDAFGKRRNLDWTNDSLDLRLKEPHATDKGYTSQMQLDGVALIHYDGRVYDPILGRFTSADPIVQAPGDIQSYNRYAYVRNNPLAYTDPSGFSWLSKQWRRVTREVRRWESNFREDIKRYVAYKIASGAALAGFAAGGPKGAIAAYHGTYKSVRAYQHGASPGNALRTGAFRGLQAYGAASLATAGYNAYAAGDGGLPGIGRVIRTAAHHAGKQIVRDAAGTYVQREYGISLFELDVALLSASILGNGLVGSRVTDNFDGTGEPGINGVLSRENDGLIRNDTAQAIVGAPFDVVDIVLGYQGIPTASAIKYLSMYGGSKVINAHSLGTLDATNLVGLGFAQRADVISLPIGNIAPGGVSVTIGALDLVNGGFFGGYLNPGAHIVGNNGPYPGAYCHKLMCY